jgi:signal transduction histidine kinase
MAIDVMAQQAVVAFVGEQNTQLRVAAEAELKYLSFLSHDLNNNLSSVTLFLQLLRKRLDTSPEFAADVETLDGAQQAVLSTIGGMARLLDSERLRKSGMEAERRPVNLHDLLVAAARQSSKAAEKKGIKITVDAAPDAVAETDRELIGLVVQNLVGNAVKYSSTGTVRVSAVCAANDGCKVSVADEGPGIAAEHLARIFDAFARGEMHGQHGVGLGLTIASQAAKLLGGKLVVESKVGVGSKFALTLPPA